MAFRKLKLIGSRVFGAADGFAWPRSHAAAVSFLALSLLLSAAPRLHAEGSPARYSGCTQPVPKAQAKGGQKAYVDPNTGELTSEPPPGEKLPEPAAATSAPSEVPVQVRPDGTVVADVGNRFMTELRAEVVDGKVVTCHHPATAPRETSRAGQKVDRAGKPGDGKPSR